MRGNQHLINIYNIFHKTYFKSKTMNFKFIKQISTITHYVSCIVISPGNIKMNKNNVSYPKGTHCSLWNKDSSQDGECLWRHLEKGHAKDIFKVSPNLESNFTWFVTTGERVPTLPSNQCPVAASTSHSGGANECPPSAAKCQASS